MSALCLGLAGVVAAALAVPDSGFTLAWMHSVEKIRWEEHYVVHEDGLVLDRARVQGSGAGMEIPDDATFADGFWTYHPKLPSLQPLRLTRSGYTRDYELCIQGRCESMTALLGPPDARGESAVELWSCRANGATLPANTPRAPSTKD